MSEVMIPISFEQLVDWVLQEKKKENRVRTASCVPGRWNA